MIAPELKEKADSLKNEGNELMKQEKFTEALEKYKEAIEINSSNAVYYCNRAAACSKLSDFVNSIEDCKNALKIDPSYGKAWGRLGYFCILLLLECELKTISTVYQQYKARIIVK